MSFRCEVCGKVQESRHKPKKVILEVRRVIYVRKGKKTNIQIEGSEIVKEVLACPECAEEFENVPPKVIENITRIAK